MKANHDDLLRRAAERPRDADAARRAVQLLDLTELDEAASDAAIERLCERAAAHGVAAVCVQPDKVVLAAAQLHGSPVRVATVANFPHGGDDLVAAADEAAAAAAAGADEVDVVIPIDAVRAGDFGLVEEQVRLCRTALPPAVGLKVILETGILREPNTITAAARAAVMAGCQFLKTSTGRSEVGATPEAAAVLLAVIGEAEGQVGLKVSGGVRDVGQAAGYLYLADTLVGPGWATPATFRFGASKLLDDALAVLGEG